MTVIILNIGSSSAVHFFMRYFEKALINNHDSKNAIIAGLASLAEFRDSETGSHLERISKYTIILAKELKK